MSFSSEVKAELCRTALSRRCCAQAEAYGVLLYCNTFQGGEARVVTECAAFAQRLPQLAGSGIAGAAVISAVFAQPDIPAAVRGLLDALERTVAP